MIHPEDRKPFSQSIRRSAKNLSVWKHEYRIVNEGEERWLQGNAVPELMSDGTLVWSGFITDISDKKRDEARIHQLAYYDDLTGLPNRRLFEERLERSIVEAERHKGLGAVLYMDLDDFKSLNDTLGHSFGDELLKQLSNPLRSNFRDTDFVARLGGDEFVVVLNNLSENRDCASEFAKRRAEVLLERLQDPLDLRGYLYKCEASIGITLFGEGLQTREELLQRADAAMYKAKSAGRNVIRFHDPHMQSRLAQRFRLEVELRQAIDRGELWLAYQPQVDSCRGLAGFEALLRWKHPSRGNIPPSDFIPIAEDNGLIVRLGEWVLELACQEQVLWQRSCPDKLPTISVNVSSKQFHQADFVDRVVDIVDKTGALASHICLEVTESMVLADLDDTLNKMEALREKGFKVAMDDFGTGFSSMAYLCKLPFDEVKIDKSFVQQTEETSSGNEWVVIETIITLAHRLGMWVVAEGIESSDQFKRLSEMGCDRFQGYYFGAPSASRLARENFKATRLLP